MAEPGILELRRVLESQLRKQPDLLERWAREEKVVVARFGEAFSPQNLASLKPDTLEDFLYFEHNRHWRGIYRQKRKLLRDFEATRRAIGVLVNENLPLAARFDQALNAVSGFGKAVATAILLVVYPERYGVWNRVTEEAMRRLGLWPEFPRGATAGQRYGILNQRLNAIAEELGLDLWALDSLWGEVLTEDGPRPDDEAEGPSARFALERALRDFLVDNWEATELGREWELYTEEGDLVGVEYPAGPVGRIDLLARHRDGGRWLVVELKLGRTSDRVVGQLLRYMGWVEAQLAKPDEKVQGAIVCESLDEKLRYALRAIPGREIEVFRYRVRFHLEPEAL